MPMRLISALLAVILFTASFARGADWPQWRGPNRDGVSTETGLLKAWPKAGPNLAWKIKIEGVGYSTPVVVGDKIFVSAAADDVKGNNEFVLCLNVKDGSQNWKADLPDNDKNYETGWGSGPRSTPTVDGNCVFALSARGELVCLKTSDGSKVWGVSLTKDFGGGVPSWGYSESVLIDGDKLICTPGGGKGTMLALDKKTGQKIWQSADPADKGNKVSVKDGAAYASIIPADISGIRQYITQTTSAAIGVQASDGKLLWRVAELKRAVAVIPTPVVEGNFAFFTSGYGAGCELIKVETKDGVTKAVTEYTKNPSFSNHHGGVVRIGDFIYGHTDHGGKWVCYDYKKGGEDFVWESKALGKGCVACADGYLYCVGEDPKKGIVALVEASPKGWNEKGRFELPEKSTFPRRSGMIWTHPVIANGKLYLRDHEWLFCYDIAAK
jgi:outer membrane protein assembly factor BamB